MNENVKQIYPRNGALDVTATSGQAFDVDDGAA